VAVKPKLSGVSSTRAIDWVACALPIRFFNVRIAIVAVSRFSCVEPGAPCCHVPFW
jgi:hypothetical protein